MISLHVYLTPAAGKEAELDSAISRRVDDCHGGAAGLHQRRRAEAVLR